MYPRKLWELDVGGSNPSTPTKEFGRLGESERVAVPFAVPACTAPRLPCAEGGAGERIASERAARCECGATLANIVGVGVEVALWFECARLRPSKHMRTSVG